MIAAAFLVLLRPYSIQCALFLLLLLLGTIATILFFCCWHRRLQKGRHPIKSVFSGRSRSRDAVMRTHHFRSEKHWVLAAAEAGDFDWVNQRSHWD
ncbi:hypothetical protein Y1Q_0014031 [Alligator mississippiensis]|uniref:Dystonin n=1 Tax=Alligator mississippiensis TaxID=8496 RepID=A0A151PEE9_ALLMI|nr:hypothetical protein Y1Q_0014031 [Alligator mississippiensis]